MKSEDYDWRVLILISYMNPVSVFAILRYIYFTSTKYLI